MNGFTKLFGSILGSSVWRESLETKVVWVTMLAMADRDGVVTCSIPGLAGFAGVTPDECGESLRVFLSPDKWSSSKEHEGRRIEEVEGGWRLLNYEKYRQKASPEERREKDAARQARRRQRLKQEAQNGAVNPPQAVKTKNVDTDALVGSYASTDDLCDKLAEIHGPPPIHDAEATKAQVNAKIQRLEAIEDKVRLGMHGGNVVPCKPLHTPGVDKSLKGREKIKAQVDYIMKKENKARKAAV